MTIGYRDMTSEDFNSYFSEGFAFHYENGAYRAYQVGGVDIRDYPTDIGEECVCMYPLCGQGEVHSTRYLDTVRELFDEPAWIMHRFRVGYVSVDDTMLVRLGLEPDERRMFKGTSFAYRKFRGILDAQLEAVPPRIQRTIAFQQAQQLPDAHISSDPAVAGTIPLAIGIAKVLSYGHMHCTNRMISPTEAKRRSLEAINDMLNPDSKRLTLALSDSVAFVRHRSDKSIAYLLINGSYGGFVQRARCADGTTKIVAHLTVGRVGSSKARALARQGLGRMAIRMFAEEVVWS